MAFTDEQFDKLMKAIDTREMLIRIDENTKNFHQNISRRLDEHIAQDYIEHGSNQKAVHKAHERVDEIERGQAKTRGIVVGVTTLATAVIAALQLYIAYAK